MSTLYINRFSKRDEYLGARPIWMHTYIIIPMCIYTSIKSQLSRLIYIREKRENSDPRQTKYKHKLSGMTNKFIMEIACTELWHVQDVHTRGAIIYVFFFNLFAPRWQWVHYYIFCIPCAPTRERQRCAISKQQNINSSYHYLKISSLWLRKKIVDDDDDKEMEMGLN